MRTRSACARSASASWRATPRTTSTSTGTTTTRTLTCAPPQTALPARARQPGPSARRAAPADRRPRRSGAGLGVGRRGDVEEAQDEAPQHKDAGREAAGRQPEQELHRGPPRPSGPSPRPQPPGPRARGAARPPAHRRAFRRRPQLLEIMEYDKYPKHVPNYLSATTAPPRRPPRHFCVVCGEAGPYTHPLDGARCDRGSRCRRPTRARRLRPLSARAGSASSPRRAASATRSTRKPKVRTR